MELSGRRVLVTGGAGLVGPPLATRLAEQNEVVVADDPRRVFEENTELSSAS